VAGNTLLRSTPGKVVVLGDIFVDVALRVPYYPEEGFDAMAREIDIRQGGSSTATSIVLSKLGIKSRVLGRVGDDPLGDIVLGLLEESGISTECIQRDMNNRTGLLFAVVSDHGERTMFAYRGDKGQLRAMNAAVLDRVIALKEELPSRSVRQIIDIMTAEGTIEPGEVAEGNSKVRKRAAKSALAGRSQVRAVHSRQHRQTKKDLPDRIHR
jgi:bifunctional ADP-heptose synthase (sugar kinase/adenylyltransferase)